MAGRQANGNSAAGLLARAHALANAGDAAGAEKLLRRVPRAGAAGVDAARMLGALCFARGDYLEAGKAFARVLKTPAADAQDHINHA
ncbi:MAG: hypothetical protein JJ899_16110, partial [Alphaproteobacteria bacterium]|nr:hypothetical protein [Alphaproteobacteria bacterium]